MFDFECNNNIEDSVDFRVPSNLHKQSLFSWYKTVLEFPYFGYNWDSLYDLLCDLSWIDKKHIWICHDGLPDLLDSELQIYISVLSDAINSSRRHESHTLHVSFPVSVKISLDEMISKNQENQ